MAKPDFAHMSGPQLLVAYNQLVVSPRKAKFKDLKEGITRCERAYEEWLSRQPKASEPTKATKPSADGDGRVIRLLSEENPRKPGTDAHAHWELMKGSPTVSQYLDKFDAGNRRRARQWLSNTVRDGHAKLLG